MTQYPVLDDLGLVIIGAAIALVVSRPLRIPPILSYIMAGLVLGPLTGILAVSDSLHLFAELGVALLLFVVGLELSLEKLRAFGRTAAVAGALQVTITFGLAALFVRAFGFDWPSAFMTGLVAAFSSTAVVVKLLDHAGALEATHGRLAIGILLVQDVLVVVVLTTLGGLSGVADGAGQSPLAGLGMALLAMTGLVAVGAVVGRWLLPPLIHWLSRTPEGLFIVGLTWAFGFIVAAESLHLSIELGAFVAGVILAQLPDTEELHRETHPLVDFFLAVFFVSLGADIDTGSMLATWPAALAVSAFVLTVKPVLITVLLGWLGQTRENAILAGVTLGQISEFAFILAGLAAGLGIVDADFLGFVGLVGLITIGASAVIQPQCPAFIERLSRTGVYRWLPGTDTPEASPLPPRSGHVVVVGMNTLGRLLVRRFDEAGDRVLAVDTDPGKLEDLGVETLLGNATLLSVFEKADIPRARLAVSALQIEDANNMFAYRCERAGVPVSIHAFDPSLIDELTELGADHLMVSKYEGIRLVEDGLVDLGVIG